MDSDELKMVKKRDNSKREQESGYVDAEIADLVTEVKEIKHPYRQGASARKGIEY